MKQEEARRPYCIVDDKFPPMTVLSNGRLICQNCGHIVFPNDTIFRCPCQNVWKLIFPRGFGDYAAANGLDGLNKGSLVCLGAK